MIESVYSLFTSVSVRQPVCRAQAKGEMGHSKSWHCPPPFGLAHKQASSQAMEGYRKSHCPLTLHPPLIRHRAGGVSPSGCVYSMFSFK